MAREIDARLRPGQGRAQCAEAAAKARSRWPSCSSGDEDLIVGARNGPPLAVGYGEGEMFLGSDAIALAPFTNSITYLEDGDWAVVRRNRLQIYDMDGEPVERKRQQSLGTSFLVDKGNHRHFMEKEIHEQPEVISHTLAHYLDFANGTSKPLDLPFDFAKTRPAGDLGLRHRLSRRADRQILVRALCAAAGRHRCRVRVPLPRDAAVEGQRGAVRLAVGRDGRHAGVAALLPQRRPADRRHRQCARIDHRARIRRDLADAGRPRDRRRLDQGLHLPACRARRRWRCVRRRRAARSRATRKRRWCASLPRRRALPARC